MSARTATIACWVLACAVGARAWAGDAPVAPAAPPAAAGPTAAAPPRSAEAVAEDVRAAHARGDAAALRALAHALVPSPYVVADVLFGDVVEPGAGPAVATGADRFARLRAFAAASDGNPAANGLVALVDRWAALSEAEVARERALRTLWRELSTAEPMVTPPETLRRIGAVEAELALAPWSLAAARLRAEAAQAALRLGRTTEGETGYAAATDAAAALGWRSAAGRVGLESALLALGRGDASAALERATRARERLEAVGATLDGLRAGLCEAHALVMLGRTERARALATRGLEGARAAGDRTIEADALSALAAAHSVLGEDAAADEAWDQAQALLDRVGAREPALRELVNRAFALFAVQRYGAAIDVYDRVLARLKAHPYARGEAVAELSLSAIYRRFERADVARAHAERAVAAARLAASPELLDHARSALATALASGGKREEAVAIFREIEDGARARGDRTTQATAQARLASELGRMGRDAEALALQEEAVATFDALGDVRNAARARAGLAYLHETHGDLGKALEAAQRALGASEALGARSMALLGARRVLARLHLRAGRPGEALALAREVQADQRVLSRGLAESDAMELHEDARGTTDVAIHAALDLAAADPSRAAEAAAAAFELAEAARAPSLVEGLSNAPGLLAAGLSEELRAADAETRRRLDAARRAVAGAPTGTDPADVAERTAAAADLEAAWRARDEVVGRIQRAAWSAAAWVAPPPPDLAAVRAALDARTAFVHLLVLDAGGAVMLPARACAVVVRADGVRLVDLPGAQGLGPAIDAWLRLAATPGTDDAGAARRLYDLLLRPLEPALAGATRWVVVPDGPLSFLPLEGLLKVDGERRQRVIERAEVAYAPSAGVWLALRAALAPGRGERVLAIGDPAPADVARSAGTAPPALPASAAEARDAAASAPEDRRVLLLGADATVGAVEAALASAGPRFRALHFACHGVVDPVEPRGTGLLLARGEILDVDRIARDRVPADLAVLSACESARGKVARAEGVLGLPRAFFLAGVPRVVVSQWVVYDRATRPFMRRLHEGLARGAPVGEALRAAKLASLEEGGPAAHPSAWAAFVLWGLPE